jgi:hypothetical protein
MYTQFFYFPYEVIENQYEHLTEEQYGSNHLSIVSTHPEAVQFKYQQPTFTNSFRSLTTSP